MTLRRQMVQFKYKEPFNNNIEEIKKFVSFFDKKATVEVDEEYPHTLIVAGEDNLFSQRLWDGDYLIFDDEEEKTFSVGTTNDEHGWSPED